MKTLNLLLVDDEAEFVRTLAERLQLRGFEIRTAGDGEEAMSRIGDHRPDMVVLDVMMPGIGGLEVLRQIKLEHPQLPVILLTGRGSTADGMEGMRLGAFDYLMKPIDIDELIQKIHEGITAVQTGEDKPDAGR
jgi:DNA-binding response OmpR family regulator